MRKTGIIILVIVLLLIILFGARGCSTYNQLVTLDEEVKAAWAQVENQYQRRFDLIPNLVETVKGYAKQEQETFIAVTEARAKIGQAATPNETVQAYNQLESALGRLLVVVERYPELKSNVNFLRLQDDLAGTENRISVERRRYNEIVMRYNVLVRRFPSNIFAGIFGFEALDTFEAAQQAQQAPKVEFD